MGLPDPDSDLKTGPEIAGAPIEPVLCVDEIQGNIMPGFNTLCQGFVGVRWDAERGDELRRWLSSLVPTISTLAEVNSFRNIRRRALRESKPRPSSPTWRNVAISAEGLRMLTDDVEEILDTAFLTGMEQRGLGDPPAGQPGHKSTWVVGGSKQTTPHLLLIIAADDNEQVETAIDELRSEIEIGTGGEVSYLQQGQVLEGEIEHFGFRDGVSQPSPRGRLSESPQHFLSRRYVDPRDPRALRLSRPGHPLIWPGQFVFGYRGQSEDDPVAPGAEVRGGPEWMRHGSFLVFRRLVQNVPAFRSGVAKLAEQTHGALTSPDLAARLVGRWPEGTALMRNPEGEDPDPMDHRLSVNYFGYEDPVEPILVSNDPFVETEALSVAGPDLKEVTGAPGDPFGDTRCPRFAHVRKVNPRDATPTDQGRGTEEDTLRRLILRRGITWGRPYPEDPATPERDSGDRGLLFLAYQTSIEEQFEVLNSKWMNGSDGPEGGAGRDLLVGQRYAEGGRQATLRVGDMQFELQTDQHWVIPSGGGYLFAPSISALRGFAAPDE